EAPDAALIEGFAAGTPRIKGRRQDCRRHTFDGEEAAAVGERTSRPLMRGISRAVVRPSGRDVRSPFSTRVADLVDRELLSAGDALQPLVQPLVQMGRTPSF